MTLPGRKASQKDIALHWGGKKDPKGFAIKFYGFKGTSDFTISGNGTETDGGLVSEDDNLKLTCTSSITAIAAVEWYKKTRDQITFPKNHLVSMKMNQGNCDFHPKEPDPVNMSCGCISKSEFTCTLKSVQTDMTGDMWMCKFLHQNGTKPMNSPTNNLTISLTVGIKSVDIFPTAVDTVSVIASTEYTFQCNTSGKPMATMEWYKDNKTPASDDDTQITIDTITSSIPNGDLVETQETLTLPVQREDQDIGVYCRAKNAGRWFTSRTIKINVLYGPKMKTLQDISVVRGERFEYQCLYEPGNPPSLSFVWTRSGTTANWTEQNTQNLTIPSIQRSDEANYTCNVSSVLQPTFSSATTVQYDYATFHLDIRYGAENLQFVINNVSNTSVEIEEHSTTYLQCSLESDPASHMIIAKDGETILERTGVQKLTHEIMAECSDTGVYNCSGYNPYGKADDASVRLLVKCKQADFPVALIGGSVGGGVAAVLVIIGVIFIVKKFRTSANTDGYSVAEIDSLRRNAAQAYETTDTSFYDALKAGNNGFGTDSSSCKAAQTYEELSMKTDTSVYDALKKGENGHDNSQVYTSLDESNPRSHNYYGNVKKEDPVYNNTVL